MLLLKKLRKKPYCNDTHFFLIASILLLLGIKYWFFYILLALYLIFIFLKTKLIIPIFVVVLILVARVGVATYLHNIDLGTEASGYVLEVEDNDSYILLSKGIKVLVKEYNHENKPGDYIDASLIKSNISPKSYSTDFDYQEYLYSKGISYYAKGKTTNHRNNIFNIYTIKYYYMSYLKENLSEESYQYVALMVFGDNNLDDSIRTSYSILGISHILAISGLHIVFLYNVISFILLKLFKYYKKLIPIVIITIFTIIIGAPASAVRALLFLIIGALNKKGEVSYTRLDILSISCIFMLIINPYSFYSTGFILSYLVSFVIIFSSELIESKYKLLRSYKGYYLIYFSTFPIVINITNRISLLALLFSPIISIVVTIVLLPISYLLGIFPILDYAFKYIFILLNLYLENLTANAMGLEFPSFSIIFTIIYYVLFIVVIIGIKLKKGRIISISLLVSYLAIIFSLNSINPFYRITFIDCGQGDSILIEMPNDRGNILIDAYNSYDYLKDRGIKRLDCLVLTHSDNDHIGDYKAILANINVKNIYCSKYDDNIRSILKNYKYKAIGSGDSINVSGLLFNGLGPINSYKELNSNSIVLKTTILNKTYIFTGDMTVEEEKDLIVKYGTKLKCDVLKVGHHGSLTSSSKEFLDYARPSVSIISVGYQNSYGLPNSQIVARIGCYSEIYMTKDSGNITIYQINTLFHISTFR